MKKIGILFAAIVLFGAGNVFAQTADVEVSANVQAAITITVNQDVVFGNIQQGAATLDATSADPNAPGGTNIGTTAQLGTVDITGSAGASTVIDFTDATLSDGTNTAAFTTAVQDVTNTATLTSGDTVVLDGGGAVSLQVGGGLADPGTTGTFNTTNAGGSPVTITVTYL